MLDFYRKICIMGYGMGGRSGGGTRRRRRRTRRGRGKK